MPVYLNWICWIHTGISNGRLFAVSFVIILQKHPHLRQETAAPSPPHATAPARAPRWTRRPRLSLELQHRGAIDSPDLLLPAFHARAFSPRQRAAKAATVGRKGVPSPDGGAVPRGSARKHPPALCPVASSPPHQFSGCESVATFLTASISSGASEFDWGEDSGAEDHSGNWYLLFLWTILKHLFVAQVLSFNCSKQ